MQVEIPKKRYYTIGEVATIFNLNASTLRFWERHFKDIKPVKKKNGLRKYTPENIEAIQLIHHLLKEKKMTITGANKQLALGYFSKKKVCLLERLHVIRNELNSIREKL